MAVFETPAPAVHAADEMHDSLDRIVHARPRARRPPALRALQAAGRRWRTARSSRCRGDCFGDAVNVAARLLDHAGDNETLVTAERARPACRDLEQARFRSLDRMQLRGRVEPVHVYLLEGAPLRRHRRHGLRRHAALRAEPEGIRLIWLDLNRVYAGPQPAGGARPQPAGHLLHRRLARLALACAHRLARRHLPAHRPQLQRHLRALRPRPARSSSLRRGSCTLHGSGIDRPGRLATDPSSAHACASRSLHFADTQPRDAAEPVRRLPRSPTIRAMSFAPEPALPPRRRPRAPPCCCATSARPTRRRPRRCAATWPSSSATRASSRSRACCGWLILHGVILRVRPAKSAAKYASIWTPEGSPLTVWTDKQAKLLRGYLGQRGHARRWCATRCATAARRSPRCSTR